MKKVLSLVLVLALVLGSFGMAFADTDTTAAAAATTTPKDVVGTDFEGAVTALTALGVVSGYEDGTYKPANIVTRAEMAKLIIAELGLTANATGAKSTFTDLSGYGWAEGYIGYAQSLGIINGYGDGTFKPGQTVSYDEALTMIVSALGYTKDCKEMNGSWPAIYVQKARVLGITDDVKAGGAVGANRGDIAIYLYNMLTASMGYADSDGVYQPKLDKNNKPIKVIANLDAKESTNEYDGYQVIEKADADDALVNIKPYVGSFAKVFTMTKGKNDGKIIAISDVKSDFIIGEYDAANKKLTAADGTEYKLDDVMNNISGTSTEKYLKDAAKAVEYLNGDRANEGATVLDSNGKKFSTASTADGSVVTVAADLSGKTVKGVYSVAKWGSGTDATVVAEKVDADDLASIKSNKTLLGKEFTQDDNDEIDMTSFELVGVDSLDSIKADHVVYVYTGGKDKEITRVAVGTEVVKGEISKIKESESNSSKITIEGKDYKMAGEKLVNNGINGNVDADELDVEDEVQLYLDAYGYVFDYDAISGKADNYAILLETGKGGGIGSNKNEIKLFLADGTDKIFNVDGDLFKDDYVPGITTKAAIGWEITAGAIVKYGVDKDGIIDSLEQLSGTDKKGNPIKDYNLRDMNNSKMSDITKSGYYNGYEIKKDAVVFSADYTSAAGILASGLDRRSDEDEYGVTTLEKVLDKKDIVASYVVYKNKIVSMLIYDYSDSDAIYGVVTGAKKTSGDSDYEITMLVDGVSKTYGATSTPYNKARTAQNANLTSGNIPGDLLFKIDFNASGEIKALTPANDPAELITSANGDTYGYAVVNAASDGDYKNNVYSIKSGTVEKDQNSYVLNKEVRLENKATVYYNDNGDFVTGTLNDLKGLKNGSKIWFYDTKDDKNDLMNIAVIYKSGVDTGSAGSPNDPAGTVKVEDFNVTDGAIVLDGTVYSVTGTTLLYNEVGVLIATGKTSILDGVNLTKTDKVFDVKTKDGAVVSMKLVAATADKTAAATVIELINNLPASTAADFATKVTAARSAYTGLTTAQQNLVTNLAKLVAAEKVANDATSAVTAGANVNTSIGAIGASTTNKDLKTIRANYDALNSVGRAEVTNLATLTAAETAYENARVALADAIAAATTVHAAQNAKLDSFSAANINLINAYDPDNDGADNEFTLYQTAVGVYKTAITAAVAVDADADATKTSDLTGAKTTLDGKTTTFSTAKTKFETVLTAVGL